MHSAVSTSIFMLLMLEQFLPDRQADVASGYGLKRQQDHDGQQPLACLVETLEAHTAHPLEPPCTKKTTF